MWRGIKTVNLGSWGIKTCVGGALGHKKGKPVIFGDFFVIIVIVVIRAI